MRYREKTSTDNPVIKPCPFCGSKDTFFAEQYTDRNKITFGKRKCADCKSSGPYVDIAHDIELWNRRCKIVGYELVKTYKLATNNEGSSG